LIAEVVAESVSIKADKILLASKLLKKFGAGALNRRSMGKPGRAFNDIYLAQLTRPRVNISK